MTNKEIQDLPPNSRWRLTSRHCTWTGIYSSCSKGIIWAWYGDSIPIEEIEQELPSWIIR